MSFFRAFVTVSGLTLASRVLGLARDLLTAALLGAGPLADAFFVALKLPNFFRRLFAEGAFSASFVPMFSSYMGKGDRKEAMAFARESMAFLISVLLPFTVICILFMDWVIRLIAPGFADDPVRFQAAIEMGRVTFPYLMAISLVSLLGGVLNSIGRFGPFAGTSILFNLTLIGALLGARWLDGSAAHFLAWGVAISGVVQLFFMALSAWRAGVAVGFGLPRFTPRVKRLLVLMGPAAIGAGVVQINLFIDVILASFLPTGAVSYLYYADRLNQMPLGIIGIAIGTALLPMLSQAIAGSDRKRADRLFAQGVEMALLFSLPAAVALVVAAEPILRVLFERGQFGLLETQQTARALRAFALGLPAYMLLKVFSTAFFARQDTVTPVKVAAVGTVLNTALGAWFVFCTDFAHAGLAAATALTAWLQVLMLGRRLMARRHHELVTGFWGHLFRMSVCAGAMGAGLWLALPWLAGWLAGGTGWRVLALFCMVLGGGAIYGALAIILRVTDLEELRRVFRRRA